MTGSTMSGQALGGHRPLAVVILIASAIVVIAASVTGAVLVARGQASAAEKQNVAEYAQASLRRLDSTIDQEDSIVEAVAKSAQHYGGCSTQTISLMRRLALADEWIQAVGYVKGDHLICSSEAGPGERVALGAASFHGALGVATRLHVRLPFAPGQTYVVSVLHGVAVIINRNLVLADEAGPGVALADYSVVSGLPYDTVGKIDRSWLRRHTRAGSLTTFTSDGELVVVAHSSRWPSGTVAAVSLTTIAARTKQAILWLVPLGVVAGAVMALALFFLARARTSLSATMRSAIRRREFFVEYQPIVDLSTEEWCGAGALIRWRRKRGEVVSPAVFMPLIEACELGPALTALMLDLVREEARAIFAHHPDFCLSLNLCPADLHRPDTVDRLERFARETGAGRQNLAVEATERDILDTAVSNPIISAIRSLGIRVLIDDFGTGYSSLAYLANAEFDGLKIDKAFVDSINTDSATSQVVFHIIQMATALSYTMTAEGVETPAQAAVLREHGVRHAQGWLFAKAMPFDELDLSVAAHNAACPSPELPVVAEGPSTDAASFRTR